MAADIGPIQFDGGRALTGPLQATNGSQGDLLRACGSANTNINGFIALIESRTFIRECIRRSIESALPFKVETFSNTIDLQQINDKVPRLLLLSYTSNYDKNGETIFDVISQLAPKIPVIILAFKGNAKMAKDAIFSGAKGYIPVTSDFEITIEAVRFVLAGGHMFRWTIYLRRLATTYSTRSRSPARLPRVNLRSYERSSSESRINS